MKFGQITSIFKQNKIKIICEKYKIKNYTINEDMSIDVDGDVNLSGEFLNNIPLTFNKIAGDFYCSCNNLSSLKGCPTYVEGHFNCGVNILTSLEYCPLYIGKHFSCQENKLTTFKHIPINFYIGKNIYCNRNNIPNSSEYSRLLFGTINGNIFTGSPQMNDFLNKHKNPLKKDLPKILSELRKLPL